MKLRFGSLKLICNKCVDRAGVRTLAECRPFQAKTCSFCAFRPRGAAANFWFIQLGNWAEKFAEDDAVERGNAGTTGSLAGNVMNNATLAFERSDAVDFGGKISGTGVMEQGGTGTLTLANVNTYSGGTAIRAGTLAGSATSFGSGAIDIGTSAMLAVRQDTDAIFANTLSGSGGFTKGGSAALNLTGNSSAFAGTTDVKSGTLAVNGTLGGSLTVPDGAPPAVFDNLSGEAHASVTSSLMASGTSVRTLPLAHLRTNLSAGLRPGAPTAQVGGTLPTSALPVSAAQPAWAELVGNWQTLDGNGNAAKTTQRTGGLFVGADHPVGNGWRVGGAIGYTDGNIHVDDRESKADVSSYSAALFGGRAFEVGAGKLNLLVGTAYTWHNIDTERYANVAGTSQKLTANYGANTTQLFTELGYAMALSERAGIEPFAGLAWSDLRTRGFSESGGSAALSGQRNSDKQTSSTLGLRAQTAFLLGQTVGQLRATLGWRHAFGEVTPQSTMAFDGGQAFTVAGAPIARNTALAELGADIAISRNATLGLNYSGEYGGGNREHAGSANVRWRY